MIFFYDGGVDRQKWWLLICNQYYQVQSELSPSFLFTTWTFSFFLNPVFLLRRQVNANQMIFIERACLPMQETQEMWVLSLGQEDSLEEEMATHSSSLAWGILWTEKPRGLQPMGSQRVRQDRSDLAHSTFNKQFFEFFELLKIVTSKIAHIFVSEGQNLTYYPLHTLVKLLYRILSLNLKVIVI